MVGKNTQYHRFERSIDLSKQPKMLEIKNLCLPKKGGGWTLDHVSLDLKKGEVLGIYGLLGAGRSELFECLMGLHPEHTGDVFYEGKKLKIKDVATQIQNGFALVPEDRQSQGLIQTLLVRLPLAYFISIQPNASLTNIGLAAPVSTIVGIVLNVGFFIYLERVGNKKTKK